MKTKHLIHYTKDSDLWTSNGKTITPELARQIWNDGTGNWTQTAYLEMARRVLS